MLAQIPVLLTTSYFGPVQYFTKLLQHPVILEKHEHFSKQTYRNRCVILGANGPQTLVVPVIKARNGKILITDVLIDYAMKWQANHLKSIESAYRSAPFYEYYIDEFIVSFEKRYKYLFDLNLELIKTICEVIQIESTISFTEKFEKVYLKSDDYRHVIHPKTSIKKPDNTFQPQTYNQVFMEKFNFVENLSILDLIFNEGPQAKNVLLASSRKIITSANNKYLS